MTSQLLELFRALRPKQWTKNAVVFAAFVFALGDHHQDIAIAQFWLVAFAAACFCGVSSGIYLLNDVRDAEQDRRHPHKKHRPVAKGTVSPSLALVTGIILILLSLTVSYFLRPELAYTLASYVGLQLVYTLALKRIAMIDVLVIASGFVLRAIAGAVAIEVVISPWLLVCTFFLALFLGLCKRRQELVTQDAAGTGSTRASLNAYDQRLLDQLISITAACTLVCYGIYTLSPETLEKFGTPHLAFTLPFVVFGLFRYLHLVYRHDLGERPEQVLLTDLPILVDLALYGLCVMAILYR